MVACTPSHRERESSVTRLSEAAPLHGRASHRRPRCWRSPLVIAAMDTVPARGIPALAPARVRLRGHAAADRRGADDLAALHRCVHGRGARAFGRREGARDRRRLRLCRGDLLRIAGEVSTVERIGELAAKASEKLADLGYDNVHVLHADGTLGWPEHAPYDAIIVAAGGHGCRDR